MPGSETQQCQNCKNSFTIDVSDFEFYDKIKVPAPTFCPECRAQRRATFRNERNFFKRKCDLCKKDMVSIYQDSVGFPVYCQECYWSDRWDSLDYGQDYDSSKNYFEQYHELTKRVPRSALINKGSTNSYYTHLSAHNKDSYMLIESSNNDSVIHGYWMQQCRDSLDNAYDTNAELCYETLAVFDSYRLRFSLYCFSCSDSWFLKNCTDCQHCFACINLKHKKYCFFNKQLSKDEYEQALKQYDLKTYERIEKAFGDAMVFYQKYPQRYAEINNCPGSTGNYMTNSRNCKSCYYCNEAENSKYSAHILDDIHDSYDVDTAGMHAELLYEDLNTAFSVSRIRFSNRCWTGLDIQYCENLDDCVSCFGCISLRQKSYCILNKQYSGESFQKLTAEIIESMKTYAYFGKNGVEYRYGEFFPSEFSPFAYNDTIAQEYFPLSRQEAEKKGYTWRDPVDRNIVPTRRNNKLPPTIKDVDESLLNEIIQCQHDEKCNDNCTKGFRIISQELGFYRKMGLPLPRFCPNCRHARRTGWLNAFQLNRRKCACAGAKSENGVYQNITEHFHESDHCPNEFETSYAPDRPEIVYCEKCYNNEVV